MGIFGINERFGQEKQVKSLGVCWNRLYEGIEYPFRVTFEGTFVVII